MITLLRTDSENSDFATLVSLLDNYLSVIDGEDHSFYAQYNKLDNIRHVVIAYQDGVAAGCGAIKPYTEDITEVKRMFVHPDHRRAGIAMKVLAELEEWARQLNFDSCILETGKQQLEAINLYQKMDYQVVENYGQYRGVDNSICMQKIL